MNTPLSTTTSPDLSTVATSIAAELRPVSLDPARGLTVERQLAERVRRSVEAHRDFTTVRREDSAWAPLTPGVGQRLLHEANGMRTQLLQVDANQSIPWLQAAHAEEILVVDGSLVVDADGVSTLLSRFNQLVVDRAKRVELRAGHDGARLYVRCRIVDLDQLPADEAQWWTAAQKAPLSTAGQAPPWSVFLEGADAADLQTHGEVASMLVRIAPGAMLPDHGHNLDEDCYMLDGDMFLGDILMRAGDYQSARAGCEHVGIMSDAGGLFYFHGAVPAPASEQTS